ncbi:MAG: hypothetical protein ACYC7D_14025 [Nitrososphaerales archaeon]
MNSTLFLASTTRAFRMCTYQVSSAPFIVATIDAGIDGKEMSQSYFTHTTTSILNVTETD